MNLTTKGRYAVMAMVDIALQEGGQQPVKLAAVADRQDIALNYLEQIFVKLRKAALVKSVRGPGGGYMLAKPSDMLLVSDIIHAVDEPMKMTRCDNQASEEASPKGCMHDKSFCVTHTLWDGLGKHIEHYLASVSLQDVCDRRIPMHFGAMERFINIEEAVHG